MKISTRGRYALRLMIDLASQPPDRNTTLRDVSQRQGISIKYLEQIVSPLCRSGMLKSIRGAQGGYRLARSPKEYTAGDVLRAIEGNLAPVACLEDDANQCTRCSVCPTLAFWEGLNETIQRYVDSFTLEQLAGTSCPMGSKAHEEDHPAEKERE